MAVCDRRSLLAFSVPKARLASIYLHVFALWMGLLTAAPLRSTCKDDRDSPFLEDGLRDGMALFWYLQMVPNDTCALESP